MKVTFRDDVISVIWKTAKRKPRFVGMQINVNRSPHFVRWQAQQLAKMADRFPMSKP